MLQPYTIDIILRVHIKLWWNKREYHASGMPTAEIYLSRK
jgi:hypothetical protein